MSNSFFTIPPHLLFNHHALSVLWPWLSRSQTAGAAAPLTGARSAQPTPHDPMHCGTPGFLSRPPSPRVAASCGLHIASRNLNPTVMTSATTQKPAMFQRLCHQGHLSADQPAACYLFASSAVCNSCLWVVPLRYYTTATFLKVSPGSSLWIPAAFVILWHRTLSIYFLMWWLLRYLISSF